MLKLASIVILSVLFIGCTPHVKPETHKNSSAPHEHKHAKMPKMFQTVSPEQATLLQKGEHKHSCAMCGMDLVKFYKTNHAAVHNDKQYQYCSLHCLTKHLNQGVELKNPQVVDVSSLKMIPVLNAYYVVGSDVKGTMSRVSKYAFASLKDAQKFQAEHGGKIVDFNDALDLAKKDFE